jgi:cell division inhibitor SepF
MAQFMNRMLNFFGLTDDEEDESMQPQEPRAYPQPAASVNTGAMDDVTPRKGTVVSLHTQKQVKVILCEPESYNDAAGIADHIRNRKPVILNLHKSPYDHAVRIIDFLSGTTYALSGTMQKLGHHIFLCAPDNVDIQGNITDILSAQQKDA